ncbi:MAG: class I SAM-dependent methyltransferase [Gammaproteobacteria bacterium]|nr:class I SAM-dependent methyltransferase [Gammaproteobacteria bacterium]
MPPADNSLLQLDSPDHHRSALAEWHGSRRHVYWNLIRDLKPRQIIETGSGQSPLLAIVAAETNHSVDGAPCTITAIEPFPPAFLETRRQNDVTLIRKKLQEVDADLFQKLEKDDILFIDSSHVLREGSDVQLEYLEILPRLNAGVLVHVHDISLPCRYPKTYFEQNLSGTNSTCCKLILFITVTWK